jgi:DNA modification methylase
MPIPLLIQAESRAVPLADKSVHCIVTSPPYFSLRDYGTGVWHGGEPGCDHRQKAGGVRNTGRDRAASGGTFHDSPRIEATLTPQYAHTCGHCGATRIDQQLGLEKLHDCAGWATGQDCGACYICHMREVARECWRVLRDDGVMFVNIGDSYAGSWGAQSRPNGTDLKSTLQGGSMLSARQITAHPKGTHTGSLKHTPGLKNKDLCGIPWRLAFALQADGWTLRSEIIWHKPNPMPESVTDRPTRSHEQVFLFSKKERYFYDAEAIRDQSVIESSGTGYHRQRRLSDGHQRTRPPEANRIAYGDLERRPGILCPETGRNARTVWEIATEPFSGPHFATMPTALVRRCILAGTSEHGVCSACKAPWLREMERTTIPDPRANGSRFDLGKSAHHGHVQQGERYLKQAGAWRPTCTCGAPSTRAIVFDPFCGSGTTLAVACAVGRDSLGTDLSYPYLHDIARLRLADLVAQPSLLYDAPRIEHNPRAEQITLL